MRAGRVAVAVAVVVSLAVAPAPASARTSASCGTTSTAPTANQSSARRPVIFVHGWTADGGALTATAESLVKLTNNQIRPYFFDYGAHATTWAGAPVVAGCLSDYVKSVSQAYRAARGDGRVLLVGHSMGGIATLYASATAGADMGGVVTFDTPYDGSPFGDTGAAAILEAAQNYLKGMDAPPAGSDAQKCLASHDDGAALATACGYALPPYLPAAVPLTEIGGAITVRRTFLGIHLYDMSFDSDGIVPTPSSLGYITAGPKASRPKGEQVQLRTDACTIGSDAVTGAVSGANWTGNLLGQFNTGVASLYRDGTALDGLLAGRLNGPLFAYLLALTMAAPCSHVHVYKDPSALALAADALKADLARLNQATTPLETYPVQDGDRSYTVKTWVRDAKPLPCAGNAYGRQVIDYLATHYCENIQRVLASTVINGRPVGISQSAVSFGEAPGWVDNGNGDLPSYHYAGGFAALVQRDGTGSIVDLLRAGHSFPGSGTQLPTPDAFDVSCQDSGCYVFDLWYLDGPTPANDPVLVEWADHTFLQVH